MGLIAQIQRDVRFITTNSNDFAIPVVFTTPGNSVTATVKAIAVKHSTEYDDIGAIVRGKTARVTVCEEVLADVGYPVRANDNSIDLKDHKVSWADSAGITYAYVIREIVPNRRTGEIRCILGDYKTGVEPKKIIGYVPGKIMVHIVSLPNPSTTQTLDNGDIIALEYHLNNDGTLTIPYMAGLSALATFLIDNNLIQNGIYTKSTGTFDNSMNGGFLSGNNISFDASIPSYLP